jgi:hypothetical protein
VEGSSFIFSDVTGVAGRSPLALLTMANSTWGYVKGLSGPYCMASAERDRQIQEHAPVQPISEEEYHRGIEAIAGKFRCHGQYTFGALIRCTQCRSTRVEEGETIIMYD